MSDSVHSNDLAAKVWHIGNVLQFVDAGLPDDSQADLPVRFVVRRLAAEAHAIGNELAAAEERVDGDLQRACAAQEMDAPQLRALMRAVGRLRGAVAAIDLEALPRAQRGALSKIASIAGEIDECARTVSGSS